jgi:phospholipid transport system transporter-binding protein
VLKRHTDPNEISVVELAPGRIALVGPLEYETAQHAHDLGLALITASRESTLEVDCAQVSRCDSSALAVLIDWMAIARARHLRLCVTHVPADLRAIARISEVDELLEQGVECGESLKPEA